MLTHPANALAEMFEVDRSTMLRALRSVSADVVKRGNRPTWKVSAAANALEAHHRKKDGGGNGEGPDPTLTAMRAQLEARRAAACDMVPSINELDEVSRSVGIANGQDPELLHLRCDQIFRLYLRGIEGPCEWTHEQAFEIVAGGELTTCLGSPFAG
jgi:hypothetical protein